MALIEETSLDLIILLAHGLDEPGFALHALHLALAASALGDNVGLYLAVEGTTLLSPGAARELTDQLSTARDVGIHVYACPGSLAAHGLNPPSEAYEPLGATAAVDLMERTHTVISL